MKFLYGQYVGGDLEEYFPDYKSEKEGGDFPSGCEGKSGVFIPAKDMLSHSKGFLSLYDKYVLPFDKTTYDIISKSLFPQLREIPELGRSLLPKLEKIMGGKVLIEHEMFFIEREDGTKIPFSMESEGIKKFAMLWQLIRNDSISEHTVLFWDEPESNLNGDYLLALVEILCELSKSHVQIFLATHSVQLAECLDGGELSCTSSDTLRFHRLYTGEQGYTSCESKERFADLRPHLRRNETYISSKGTLSSQ